MRWAGCDQTSHRSNSSCGIRLYMQGWMKEDYGTGGISINAQRFGVEEDEAL